jgi:cyclophilin family peptidyl-prolyl cis-trans isomerase
LVLFNFAKRKFAKNKETKKMMKSLIFPLSTLFLSALLMSNSGCSNPKDTSVVMENSPAAQETTKASEEGAQPAKETEKKMNTKVKVTTSQGEMIIELYNETPQHRDNFIKLVNEGFYNDLLFHRCIRNFMAQGGDPESRGASATKMLGMGGPGYTIPAEFNAQLIHKKGALAAARQGDQVNPQKKSSGSQFYIVQGSKLDDNQLNQFEAMAARKMPGFKYTEDQRNIYKTIGGTAMLDMDYTVFGEVVEGIDVLDKILAQPTKQGDRPVTDITMKMEIIH